MENETLTAPIHEYMYLTGWRITNLKREVTLAVMRDYPIEMAQELAGDPMYDVEIKQWATDENENAYLVDATEIPPPRYTDGAPDGRLVIVVKTSHYQWSYVVRRGEASTLRRSGTL